MPVCLIFTTRISKKENNAGFLLAIIFPILVAAPRFFSGAIQLGGLMQIASAFSNVQTALSWFIDNYRPFAEWKSSADRLTYFHEAICKSEPKCLMRLTTRNS